MPPPHGSVSQWPPLSLSWLLFLFLKHLRRPTRESQASAPRWALPMCPVRWGPQSPTARAHALVSRDPQQVPQGARIEVLCSEHLFDSWMSQPWPPPSGSRPPARELLPPLRRRSPRGERRGPPHQRGGQRQSCICLELQSSLTLVNVFPLPCERVWFALAPRAPRWSDAGLGLRPESVRLRWGSSHYLSNMEHRMV